MKYIVLARDETRDQRDWAILDADSPDAAINEALPQLVAATHLAAIPFEEAVEVETFVGLVTP